MLTSLAVGGGLVAIVRLGVKLVRWARQNRGPAARLGLGFLVDTMLDRIGAKTDGDDLHHASRLDALRFWLGEKLDHALHSPHHHSSSHHAHTWSADDHHSSHSHTSAGWHDGEDHGE